MRAFLLAILLLTAVASARLTVKEIRSALYGAENTPHAKIYNGEGSEVSNLRICAVVGKDSSKDFRAAVDILARSNEVVVVSAGSEASFEPLEVVESEFSGDRLTDSLKVFETLQELESFDVILVEVWNGLGYMTTQAKRDGLSFLSTRIVSVLSRNHDQEAPSATPGALVSIFMERKTVEFSDFVVAGHELQCEQLASLGWKFPETLFVLPTWGATTLAAFVKHTGSMEATVVPATNEPLVSVVITTYNRGELLAKAIASVKRQSYSNIEIIVVDDGSTNTQSIAYLKTLESSVRVVRQKNLYLGAARNNGVKHSTGKYVFFLDDDNEMLPGLLENVVTAAETSGSKVVVNGHLKGTTITEARVWMPLGAAKMAGVTGDYFGSANFLIERTTFSTLGGFSTERLAFEDYEFHAKAALAGLDYAVVPKALLFYRQHSVDQMASTADALAHNRALRSYQNVLSQEQLGAAQKRQVTACRELKVSSVICEPCEEFGFEATLDDDIMMNPLYDSVSGLTRQDISILVKFEDSNNAVNQVDVVGVLTSISRVTPSEFVIKFTANPRLIATAGGNKFDTPASWKITEVRVTDNGQTSRCTNAPGFQDTIASCGFNTALGAPGANGQQVVNDEFVPGSGQGLTTDGQCCCVFPGAIVDQGVQCCTDFTNKDFCAKQGGQCDSVTTMCACRSRDGIITRRDVDDCFNIGGTCALGAVDNANEIAVADLVNLIVSWGDCPCSSNFGATSASRCLADLSRDGVVSILDLVALITAWGPLDPLKLNDDLCCCYSETALFGDCCDVKLKASCESMPGMTCDAPGEETRCCCEGVFGGQPGCFDISRTECDALAGAPGSLFTGCAA